MDNYRAAFIVLAVITIVLTLSFYEITSRAATYNAFCRENDYDMAGHVRHNLSCLKELEETIEHRPFECSPECKFTGPNQTHLIKPNYDVNDFKVQTQ